MSSKLTGMALWYCAIIQPKAIVSDFKDHVFTLVPAKVSGHLYQLSQLAV